MRTTLDRTVLAIAALALLALVPTAAGAQPRRHGRALYAGAQVGPFVLFDQHGEHGDFHVRINGEFGWHPGGEHTGFFLAATGSTSFHRWFHFAGGLRLGADIEVWANQDVAILLAPSGMVGGGFIDYPGGDNTYPFFLVGPAFDVKVSLANRMVQIWLRPVGFDFMFFGDYWRRTDRWAVGYQFVGGVAFTFG